MVKLHLAIAAIVAAASILFGCSGRGGPAGPQNMEVPLPSTTIRQLPQVDRERLLRAPETNPKARFKAALAAVAQHLQSSASGCTPLNGSNVSGLTAKTILRHAATNLNVDGSGCDVGVYVPPGASVTISDSRVGGAGTAQIAADENAQLNVASTNITAGQQTVGVLFFQDGSGSVRNTKIDLTGPAPPNAPPLQTSIGPAGIISPTGGNFEIDSTRIAEAQNATGVAIFENANVNGIDVEARFNPAYGPSQTFTRGIITFAPGVSHIRDSTFNTPSTDGLGNGMLFEFGGAGSATNTRVRADFVGIGLILPGNVSIEGSLVSMVLPEPPFGTYGVRGICPAPCTATAQIDNVVSYGNGYVDPTTPDFANDSVGFQFQYPIVFRRDLAVRNSVGFYSCGSPNVTSSAQLQQLLTASGNIAVDSSKAKFYAGQPNDC